MATKKYNPYNAVKSISDLKGKYHTAKELGGDYKQYQQQAEQYYEELMNNGMTDLANELTANDYIGSLDILARYKPDAEFAVDQAYDRIVGVTPFEPIDTSSRANDILDILSQPFSDRGVTTTADDILDRLYDDAWQEKYGAAMDQALGIATGAIKPETSDAVQGILDSFANTDALLNGDLRYDANGNAIGGLNIDHYNTGKNQLDFINNFDYTEQSYFDPIMQSYQLKGSDAAKGQLAGGASGNSGNIDSYAAANANRQQLAFTNAGHEAARAAAQQNFGNWQQLYDAMSGNLQSMGAINAQNLTTGANMYATEAQERAAALEKALGLADSEAQRRMNAYLSKMSDDTTRYQTDADMQKARENLAFTTAENEANRALDRYISEMNDASARYNVDVNSAIQREQMQNALEQIINQNAGQKEVATINSDAQKYSADLQYAKELADLQRENAALKEQNKTAANNTKPTTNSNSITFADGSQYTYDQIMNEIYLGILYGDADFSDINSESDFKAAAGEIGIPAETAEKYIAALRKTYGDGLSDLFEMANTARKANSLK